MLLFPLVISAFYIPFILAHATAAPPRYIHERVLISPSLVQIISRLALSEILRDCGERTWTGKMKRSTR